VKRGWKFFPLVFLIPTVTLLACSMNSGESQTHSPTPAETTESGVLQWSSSPPMTIDQGRQYIATIKTNLGDIEVQLFPQDAPLAVNNFVFLAREGFYNSVKFNRVVKGFVIQGGDPTGTGAGGPGYTFADEKVTRDYIAGVLAMANAGPDTNGSQFFITLADLSSKLPKNYTIFGQVTSGFNIVQKIGDVSVVAKVSGGEVSSPTEDVHIDTISIEER